MIISALLSLKDTYKINMNNKLSLCLPVCENRPDDATLNSLVLPNPTETVPLLLCTITMWPMLWKESNARNPHSHDTRTMVMRWNDITQLRIKLVISLSQAVELLNMTLPSHNNTALRMSTDAVDFAMWRVLRYFPGIASLKKKQPQFRRNTERVNRPSLE